VPIAGKKFMIEFIPLSSYNAAIKQLIFFFSNTNVFLCIQFATCTIQIAKKRKFVGHAGFSGFFPVVCFGCFSPYQLCVW